MLRLLPMKGMTWIVLVMVAVVGGLALFTNYLPGTLTAKTQLFGVPVISITKLHGIGLIAIGWAGTKGVLVFAQAGFGLITIAQAGVGLIFGIGQAMFGLLVLGQVGVGIAFFIGQVGGGTHALGQGVGKRWPKEYLSELNAELNELLRPPWRCSAKAPLGPLVVTRGGSRVSRRPR